MSSVTDLAAEMEEKLEETTLSDVADAVENRSIQETKDMIASDEEDEKAVDKFFYHYTGRRRKQTSEAEIVFQSPNYLVVRSEMYSGKKADYDDDGDGTYHAGWIVGPDPDQESGFFIHRLNHTRKLENPDYEWNEEEIRERMGFTREFQGMEDLEPGETYRVQGDICIEKKEETGYSGIEHLKESVVRDRTREKIREEKNRIAEKHEEEILGSRDGILSVHTSRLTGPEVKVAVSLPEDTEDLREKQEELGITEEQVRSYQDEQDEWEQLTAGRRQTAIQILLKRDVVKRMNQLFEDEIDEEEIESEIEEEVRQEWREEVGQENFQIGNHVIMFSQALESPKTRNRSYSHFIVLEESKLFVIHDEHQNQEITLDRGVYEIDSLNRHEQN